MLLWEFKLLQLQCQDCKIVCIPYNDRISLSLIDQSINHPVWPPAIDPIGARKHKQSINEMPLFITHWEICVMTAPYTMQKE